jgi:hypothetical protein
VSILVFRGYVVPEGSGLGMGGGFVEESTYEGYLDVEDEYIQCNF